MRIIDFFDQGVRYHADNKTVRVEIDDDAWRLLAEAIGRARELQASVIRPPVAANEKLCAKCSLAPVCLPEEARLIERQSGRAENRETREKGEMAENKSAIRLFPADDDRQSLHIVSQGARIGHGGASYPRGGG